MDRKKILQDGLLEEYLLGELAVEQETAVSRVLQSDAELMAQFRAMEADFERMAFENAITPPSEVRKSLEAAMLQDEVGSSKVRSLDVPQRKNSALLMRLMVAASLAAIFALSSFWLYTKWQDSEKNLQVLQQQTTGLQNRLADIEKNYRETNSRYQSINNPNVVPLLLVGNAKSPDSRAIAYVNHQTKEVVVNAKGLAPLDADHTYQMWADVEGEMISMGLVSSNQEYVALAYIDKAESLNITIEPAGGNDHPTVERLISNVSL
ncbi:anti-sigma factor [Flavobacteriaceae bacterium TP-CH-4]|uniref:Anti-sigma factor n=1 Tax=Pelagihabitans pacificus TaxID=2696054 RepID=A0A967AVU2_9FLAO|nr:anti-sigma factor [Pelagihabitans pacificus]NHF61341.1 anti-sigma factor [Pelagihabitans pacificus]